MNAVRRFLGSLSRRRSGTGPEPRVPATPPRPDDVATYITHRVDAPQSGPLKLDPDAESADPSLPAFIAKPADAPAYHGFPVLRDVAVDGFILGMITDWESGDEESDWGDAYIVAPDGSRAGLVWEKGQELNVHMVVDPSPYRWGVWGIEYPAPMRTRDDSRAFLAAIVPLLRPRWEEWRRTSD
jgi:hypothetical protein